MIYFNNALEHQFDGGQSSHAAVHKINAYRFFFFFFVFFPIRKKKKSIQLFHLILFFILLFVRVPVSRSSPPAAQWQRVLFCITNYTRPLYYRTRSDGKSNAFFVCVCLCPGPFLFIYSMYIVKYFFFTGFLSCLLRRRYITQEGQGSYYHYTERERERERRSSTFPTTNDDVCDKVEVTACAH